MSKAIKTGLLFLTGLYLIISVCFAAYYQIKSTRDSVSGIIGYRFISVGKGLIWPYYVFTTENKAEIDASQNHFLNSIKYNRKAIDIMNSKRDLIVSGKEEFSDFNEYIDMLKIAQIEATYVDTTKMLEEEPALGRLFIDEYLEGLKLQIEGHRSNNWTDFRKGALHLAEFVERGTE